MLLLLRPVVLVVLLVGTQAAVAEPANSNQEQGNRGEREEGRKRVCRDAHLASSPIVGAHVSVNTPEAVRRARVDERAAAARWARAEVATKVSSLVHQPHAAPAPHGCSFLPSSLRSRDFLFWNQSFFLINAQQCERTPQRRARGAESHRLARSAAPPSARETFLNHTTPGAVECTELPRRPRGSRLGGSRGGQSILLITRLLRSCPPTSRHPPRRYAQKSFRQRETSRPLRRRRPLEALALPLPRNQRPHHCLPVEPPPHRARSVPG